MKETTCIVCGKPIVIVTNRAGACVALDAEPVWVRKAETQETREMYFDAHGAIFTGVPVGDAYEGEAKEMRTPHFRNCKGGWVK